MWQFLKIDNFIKPTTLYSQEISNFNNIVGDLKKSLILKKQEQIISVITDVLSLKIGTRGGNINQVSLLTYNDKFNSMQPLNLFVTSKNFIYQAQSGIINNKQNKLINYDEPLFNVNKDLYILKNNQNELHVPLIYISSDNIIYIKTFIFKRGNFNCNIKYNIINMSNTPLELIFYGQLKQSINLPLLHNNFLSQSYDYRNFAYYDINDKYKKYSFKNVEEINLNSHINVNWISMFQKYFATVFIPNFSEKNILYSNFLKKEKQIIIGFKSKPFIIYPGNQTNVGAVLWMGPKIQDKMLLVAPHLDLMVDYGWLWFISKPLFKLLKFIYNYSYNWGLSIIIITLIIRFIMYPLTKAQYISMIKMHLLKSKLKKIREKFVTNNQLQGLEIIKLYKKEKVNPLGGFLLMIIQMPIFLALYNTLSESIELRHSPFILWINDLSSYDHYYILPILMGITMFYVQKTSFNTLNNSNNKKFILLTPCLFTIFFLWLPSGLVLYYIVNNVITIFQQFFIFNELDLCKLNDKKF